MRDEWIHLAKELAEIDKMWRLFKTVIWILIGIIVVALTMSCGTNHRVSGGTDHDATATVKLMKICDRTAIQVCNDDTMTIEDKLQCVKYACEFNGSLEVLGVSEENLGSILDAVDGEEGDGLGE